MLAEKYKQGTPILTRKIFATNLLPMSYSPKCPQRFRVFYRMVYTDDQIIGRVSWSSGSSFPLPMGHLTVVSTFILIREFY